MSGTREASPESTTPVEGRRRQTRFVESLVEDSGEENVKVCIRVRPFNNRELELQRQQSDKPLRSVVAMPEGMGGKVIFYEKPPNSHEYRMVDEFQYNKTFWSVPEDQQPHAFAPVSQEDVYESIGRPIIRYALAGFNNCVFAYGQTGSGKTHSMMGDFQGSVTTNAGLIPRLCVELFEKVEALRRHKEDGIVKTAEVRLSAIEIYNEQVRDLMWRLTPGRTKSQTLKIRKYPGDGSFFVDQLTVVTPESWLDCLRHIEKAVSERTVAATDMNDESSRSHCIFQLVLEQTETVHVVSEDPDDRYSKPVTNKKLSKINLVDLAGSERLKKSNAQGQQLKEAAGINLSLTTLKKVIDALVVNSKEVNPKKQILIPFRESSLTLLLADSLGGNSKTTMVACVSPHYDNQEETLLTLRYANRTGTIVNHARINEDSAAKQALRLKHEILEMQRRLAEGPVDEEAEDLQDQLEVGRNALKELEESSRKAATTAEELRKKAKMEEEAILSSAFYNSMKMALLQQQREQLETNAAEMEERIRQHRNEAGVLSSTIKEKEDEERNQFKQLDRLRKESQAMRVKELEQERQNGKLTREAQELHRKMEKEMELRYAQKMLNAFRLKKAREACKKAIDDLMQEQELKLTQVISEAAEQYEMQVRQFADAETIVHQRTTKVEKEIQQCNVKREELEAEAQQLMQTIRAAERQHVDKIHAIEKEWKERYQHVKDTYEAEIHEIDEAYFESQKQREMDVASASKINTSDQEETIKALERDVREAETLWNKQVAELVETKADDMDAMMKVQRETHAIAAAKKRKEYEGRIGELVGQLQRIQLLEQEHDDCSAYLELAVAPLMHLHDSISGMGNAPSTGAERIGSSAALFAARFAGYSDAYIALKRLLVRFEGNVSTVKPTMPSTFLSVGREASQARSHLPQVFPIIPVGRVKLKKTTYADAQANLAAAVEHSSSKGQEPIVNLSASPLLRKPSLVSRRASFSQGSPTFYRGSTPSPSSPPSFYRKS